MARIVTRPIEVWPEERTRHRKESRFRSSYRQTLKLLEKEIDHLQKRGEAPLPAVLEMFLTENQIRLDGKPRAGSVPTEPGVILSLETKWGHARFPCDRFSSWEDNVRAIALSLESLRRVDRYGVTRRGEQYTGWKRLGSGSSHVDSAAGRTMDVSEAAEILASAAGVNTPLASRKVEANPRFYRRVYMEAVKKTHPDAGGDEDDFKDVQMAREALEAHHNLSTRPPWG